MKTKAIIYSALALVTAPLFAIWSGYVISQLWLWFIVPALGVKPLSIPLAIGFAIFIQYLKYDANKVSGESSGDWDKEMARAFFVATFTPAMFLGLGYIVTLFL